MDEKELSTQSAPIENESNAARRLRLLGADTEDRIHDDSVAIKKGNFFSNLWYQHKWALIIGSILVIIAIIFIVSMVTQPKYDMYLAYAGPLYMDYETKDAVEFAFGEISKDYNGDGEKLFNFASITYQNPDQVGENPEEIKQSYGQMQQVSENVKALDTIRAQMLSGTVAIYLMDEALYKEYEASMLNLSELLGYEPHESIMAGESGVYFKKTDFYRFMQSQAKGAALSNLPDDTVLCILPRLVTMDEDVHQSSQELVKSIIAYKAE